MSKKFQSSLWEVLHKFSHVMKTYITIPRWSLFMDGRNSGKIQHSFVTFGPPMSGFHSRVAYFIVWGLYRRRFYCICVSAGRLWFAGICKASKYVTSGNRSLMLCGNVIKADITSLECGDARVLGSIRAVTVGRVYFNPPPSPQVHQTWCFHQIKRIHLSATRHYHSVSSLYIVYVCHSVEVLLIIPTKGFVFSTKSTSLQGVNAINKLISKNARLLPVLSKKYWSVHLSQL